MFLNFRGNTNIYSSMLSASNTWPVILGYCFKFDEGQYENEDKISLFCGAFVLHTRHLLKQFGIHDSRFFMYLEDIILSWRGQKAGYTYYCASLATHYHVHVASGKEGSP